MGVHLTFTDEALDLVVSKTMEQKLGARGLRDHHGAGNGRADV